jgi:hypothetical protein
VIVEEDLVKPPPLLWVSEVLVLPWYRGVTAVLGGLAGLLSVGWLLWQWLRRRLRAAELD